MCDTNSDLEIEKIKSLAKFYDSIPINDTGKSKIYTDKTTTASTATDLDRPSTAITNYSTFKDLTKYSKTSNLSTNRKKLTGSKKSKKQLKKSYSMSQLYDDMEALDLKSNDTYYPLESVKDTKNSINFSSRKNESSNSPRKKIIKKTSLKPCDIATFLGTELKKPDSKLKVSLSTTPSPVYPAARSNLAATLRAQLTHKPHLDPSPSPSDLKYKTKSRFNWDVKRTPGWKSLIYRETNKEDIMYRLATRRAEQKLQKQEYDMNMELMRQRVKSAPLLLEGMTYWNTRLNNRSYHNCIATNSSRLSTRRKKNSARKIKPMQQQQNDEENPQTENNINNNQCNDNDDLTSEDRAYL
ncbi:uncharacterized protein LOC129608140 [Condylostylus longicornis]|uniref:uncharacterized protein LOC129608140 n=1 Tax=Condylostylus longicornis TaxID=2530218 RepID=UPI00244DF9F3|nr:uncharacterized protein LOC129608140 [Condylostylus longicornis]